MSNLSINETEKVLHNKLYSCPDKIQLDMMGWYLRIDGWGMAITDFYKSYQTSVLDVVPNRHLDYVLIWIFDNMSN